MGLLGHRGRAGSATWARICVYDHLVACSFIKRVWTEGSPRARRYSRRRVYSPVVLGRSLDPSEYQFVRLQGR